MINQTVLQTVLETILPNVTIVPKQGNWFNPQDQKNYGTWVAYILRNPHPTSTSFKQLGNAPVLGSGSEISTNYFIGDVELQIVGEKAEDIAYGISLWLERSDIVALFDSHYAQLCYDGLGAIQVSQFSQDGLNGVLAYNVQFRLQWANMLDITYSKLDTASISGDLTIGA